MIKVDCLGCHGTEWTIYRAARQCRSKYVLDKPDQKKRGMLLAGLIKAGHLTPFEFCHIIFWIQCPIFIERQLLRHRTASFCELSLRREQDVCCMTSEYGLPDDASSGSLDAYYRSIKSGVRPEKARYCLPLSTMTELQMCIDLRNLMNFLELRTSIEAQEEMRDVALKMEKIFADNYPVVHAAWRKTIGDK